MGLGGYLAAKRRLFAEGCPDSIIGVDEIAGLNLAQQLAEISLGDESVIRVANKKSIREFGWSVSYENGQVQEYRKGGKQIRLI